METPRPANSGLGLPITQITRAELALFMEKLNGKIRRHHLEKSIKLSPEISFVDAFIRLPTEAEWEFCARGGNAVDSTTFDKPTPYEADTNQYEWFFGQDSSKGKLKQAGSLKANSLGIHDMLGNAAEMVEALFQVEYSQGRFGGSVVRGGDFRTELSDLRSSMRMEYPLIFEDGAAFKSGAVGFRLAVGTMILPSMAAGARLESEWKQYANTRTQPSMARPSESSVSNAAGKDLEEVSKLVGDLAQGLEVGGGRQMPARQALKLMEVRVAAIRGNMKRSDARFAKGAVSLASIISVESVTNSAKILQARNMLADPNVPEKLKQVSRERIRLLEANLQRAGLKMEDCLKMFEEIPKETVEGAFDAHSDNIQEGRKSATGSEEINDRDRQIAATTLARQVSLDYIVNRRIGLDRWKSGLMDIAKKWVEEIRNQRPLDSTPAQDSSGSGVNDVSPRTIGENLQKAGRIGPPPVVEQPAPGESPPLPALAPAPAFSVLAEVEEIFQPTPAQDSSDQGINDVSSRATGPQIKLDIQVSPYQHLSFDRRSLGKYHGRPRIMELAPGLGRQMGLRPGDLILRINGIEIDSVSQMGPALDQARNQALLMIDVMRLGGTLLQVTARL
jgi:hypothetical protein